MKSTMTAAVFLFALCQCAIVPAQESAAPATQPTAEQQEAAYLADISKRADGVVAALKLDDAAKAAAVQHVVMNQYRDLRDLHAARDKKVSDAGGNKEIAEALKNESAADVKQLHDQFLAKLAEHLTAQQIDVVKDGLTYNVLHVTYKGYTDMILTLTDEEKAQIIMWLVEARELAMDGGSSKEKHAVFGKYKGRINNYLSKRGYNTREEENKWRERRRAATQQAH